MSVLHVLYVLHSFYNDIMYHRGGGGGGGLSVCKTHKLVFFLIILILSMALSFIRKLPD